MEINFKKNLKFLRKREELTLVALSESLNISKSALSDYETGKSLPGMDVLMVISQFFNVGIDNLLNSEISELNLNSQKKKMALPSKDLLHIENERYVFNLNLLNQKLEGQLVQNQMLRQLLGSKDAEISTLRNHIKLLEISKLV